MSVQHFLTLNDFSLEQLKLVLARAIELKKERATGQVRNSMQNRVLGMIFEKASTRTRVAFESAMAQCAGHAIFLAPDNTQLGRGEPIEDTARVLSRMVDIIMLRTFEHSKIEAFAQYSQVPVINALTDRFHPCQLLADLQTYQEQRGAIQGAKVAWIGDGNNMCHSYMNAARIFDFHLNIACPDGYAPDADICDFNQSSITLSENALEAAFGADLVVTDVWASMGDEAETAQRQRVFKPYQVTPQVMQQASKDALFMHCLPAHRDEEVTADVIDGPQSVVWQEAENRLHSQKALLEFLLGC